MAGGMALASVGFGLIVLFDVETNRALEIGAMLILGVGFGGAIQTSILAAQASVPSSDVAITTSLVVFFQIIGGVIGLAVEGSIFNNKLASTLAENISESSLPPDATHSVEAIRSIAEPVRSIIIQAYADSLRTQYYVLIPIAALAALAFVFVKPLPLQPNGANRR